MRVYAHADGATYSVTLVPGANGTEIHLRYLSSGDALALPADSRLARLIHPAARPTYAGPLKPPEYRTADMDGLRGNVSSVTTRSYDVKPDGRRTLIRTQVSRYDARGRLVSVSGLDNARRLTFTDTYAFEGNLLKRRSFRNEAGTFRHDFAYDAQGHWRERKSFGPDGGVDWLVKVRVFPNGYEQTLYGADGTVSSRRRVLLNRLGVQVASEDHQGEAGDPRGVYENDRLVRHIIGSEQSGFMIVTEFDPRTGEKLKSTVSSTQLEPKVSTFTCEARDPQGNCRLTVERGSASGSSWAAGVKGIVERTIRYHDSG
ncbi:hypothetical protein GCM10008955_38000 [Deinococcus malanensis]|uniref:RHS repeat protein n=2 Tax=Deinococcus malanensis TaxID=1706855 RepID=A0ABQ2F468_9DEIO|nr:hypothetical protein GCM10008955_38000 [Deinococcus malanensis]